MNVNKARSFKFFTIFPVISFGLGSWQVYRYQWKKSLIQKAQENVEKDPVVLDAEAIGKMVQQSSEGITANSLEFRRVHITGTYVDRCGELHLGPRASDGNIGYYIISPLRVDNSDMTILVNRGWVPAQRVKEWASKGRDSRIEDQVNNSRQVVIEGLVGKAREAGSWFTPDNVPNRNEWYFIDAAAMAKVTGTKAPMIVNTLDEFSVDGKTLYSPLKRFDTNVENNFYNKHMSYIFTWYTLSGCLSVIYYKYMRVLPIKK
eukprot:gene13081-15387_t